MRQISFLIGLMILVSLSQAAELTVTDLRCEYLVNPLGIDVRQPRLSWKLQANGRNVLQTAYEIRVAEKLSALQRGATLLWHSGKIDSDQSIHVVYGGPTLSSRQRVWWQVRVWDNHGRMSPWSDPAFWEMGLLQPQDWSAQWIQPELEEDPQISNPSPLLRKEFELTKAIQSARLYITALGLYEAELNGQRVGDQLFTPGWTAYDARIQYQTFNVTELLRQGANAIGVALGDGWYRGYLGWKNERNIYGEKCALLAQLEVIYQDGSSEVVVSDSTWKAATGPIRASDIYHGERYDARLERPGWSRTGYNDRDWQRVSILDHRKDILVAPLGPPVKRIQQLKPIKIVKTPAGETVIDMGQNMVGWLRFQVTGPSGARVKLRHAEVLDKHGNFYTANLRAAKQTIEYILKGQGVETFEPHFTFQGFRYVAVDEWPGDLQLENFTGIVVHSEITPTGEFACSNPLINQLQHNIQWGQRGNFLEVPTDCPQRDERLGWTGDAQVFARTACFNADVASFYTKWLKDLALDQKPSGAVPHVIPNVLRRKDPKADAASAGWADAAVVVPWTVYLCYGDQRLLEQQYPSMKAWVDYMAHQADTTYFWNTDFTFGDWLAFATTKSDYPGATTDKDLICQVYFARSTALLQRTAALLGKKEDELKYARLLEKIKAVFQREFVTPNGRLASHTQTAYAMALAFDLLPESLRPAAAARLAKDVRQFKHITTGFLGTPLICPVLSEYGYWEEAFMLLNRTQYPSWLYPVTHGATTIWERWDGIKADSTFQDARMNSFNHYAYGAIGEWLYRMVAGIELDPERPGYKHIIIQPHPGGGLTYAQASLNSMYGKIESAWKWTSGRFQLTTVIPPNTTATVRLPQAILATVTESGKPLAQMKGWRAVEKGPTVVLEIGSGSYRFAYPLQE